MIYESVSGTPTRATFGPTGACSGKGIYSWKITSRRRLTFRLVKDACALRRTFLRTTWTRK